MGWRAQKRDVPMKKGLITALLVSGILLASGVTYAGMTGYNPVNIWTDSSTGLQSANGTLRDARNSADNTQYIGCSRYAYDTGSNSIVCYARTAAGAYLSCQTSDAGMVRVAETLNSASYLYFVVNSDGWSCNRVISVHASYNL
jgi:hypothetical protein